jgi:hypothetical protein
MDETAEDLVRRLHHEEVERVRREGASIQPPAGPASIPCTDLPPARTDSPLFAEWNAYRREVGRLLAEGRQGQFVLIKAERIVALFDGTGLVDDADGAEGVTGEVGEDARQAPLQRVASLLLIPGGGGEELLEGADGGARGESDGLDPLSGQVREQAAAVVVEVGGGAVLEEAGAEAAQERGEGGAKLSDVLIGHGFSLPATRSF